MEADSTTVDTSSHKSVDIEPALPFQCRPGNHQLYRELCSKVGEKRLESQIVERLQGFGLIPKSIKCTSGLEDCNVVCKPARVIDRVQWCCEGCGKRLPIRTGTFFLRLQCSLLQALQVILAWCEDADLDSIAESFAVKPRVALHIYNKMDDIAIKELHKTKLGGDNSVVVAEMYPDCLTRLSPDTTDQPKVDRILMLADTNHIPTHYRLHVIKDDPKKNNATSADSQSVISQIESAIAECTLPRSTLVAGCYLPPIEGAATLQQLLQYCDADMQHFLSSRIWRQALTLCAASRPLQPILAQRYLNTALYRYRFGDGFFQHTLNVLATEYTDNYYAGHVECSHTVYTGDETPMLVKGAFCTLSHGLYELYTNATTRYLRSSLRLSKEN